MKPISKSQFNLARQCKKAFYLYRYHKELLAYTDAQEKLFTQGINFGELMQQRFPKGTDVSKVATTFPKRIARTQELIQAASQPIYEATLSVIVDGAPLLCMIDILVPVNQQWHMYEVKSSGQVKEEHYADVGFQAFVAKASGLEIGSVNIIHRNYAYAAESDPDLNQLGILVDVSAEVEALQPHIKSTLPILRDIDDQPFAPDIAVGEHCTKPYACGFMKHCHKTL